MDESTAAAPNVEKKIEFQREPMDESTAAAPNVEKKVNPLVLAKDVIWYACKYPYDCSQTTATKVNTAVMEKVVPTVNQYVPDEQVRAKIGQFVGNAALYVLPEVLKYLLPAVPVGDIANAIRSLPDVKTGDYKEGYKELKRENEHRKEELKTLQARVDKLERKLSGGGDNIQDNVKFERESSVGENNQADGKNSNPHLKEVDVIRMFTMTEISGRYMFDDLVVPRVKKSRNEV